MKKCFADINENKNRGEENDGTFNYKDKTPIKTIHVGATRSADYTVAPPDEKTHIYIKTNTDKENWIDYVTTDALSRYIVWKHRNLNTAIYNYNDIYNIFVFVFKFFSEIIDDNHIRHTIYAWFSLAGDPQEVNNILRQEQYILRYESSSLAEQ